MSNIAIIPARSGSKGLPDKNIKLLCGKPLMAYSVEVATRSGKFGKVFVSTDSDRYAQIAKECGASADFLRSDEMSSDTAGSWDAVREVVTELEKRGEHYDAVMLLQPTSPLRTSEDIVNAFNLFEEKGADAVVSVTETDHSPLWCNTLPPDLSMKGFSRPEYENIPRQQLPTYYRINGAIYLIRRKCLEDDKMFVTNTYAYIMPQERSIDIDTGLDFTVAESLLGLNKTNERYI